MARSLAGLQVLAAAGQGGIDQFPSGFEFRDALLQLEALLPCKVLPVTIAIPIEELADLREREPGGLAAANEIQSPKNRGLVPPAATDPGRRGDQADIVVVTQGCGRHADRVGDLSDGEQEAPFPAWVHRWKHVRDGR